MKNLKESQSGQSLLEVVIALTILVMALSAVLALTTSNIVGQKESEFQIVANNLAREGIEVVRSIRDSNWLAGVAWDEGLTDATKNVATAEFDIVTNTWSLNFDFTDDLLYISSGLSRGLYSHDGSGQPSEFRRILTLDDICLDDGETIEVSPPCSTGQKIGVKVTSEVSWLERGRDRQVTLESFLYAWK
ncbi:MAG: hypothetical protein CMI53_01090 [Parcubacteria group bacterium]|jgi:type II secretory pathway pseudopilin PulG|nr:hypothetical protein [Parcubacteria group bacterium]|tara:strand:- start:9006 stop:9575 length:570 start_codon:yes stop_codon:yes gene_type:complete